eukprot:m.19136 g.19136  ORF g.19136 m.19136 type:complete len:296 (-) comp12350_c0_seq1:89-976(-)
MDPKQSYVQGFIVSSVSPALAAMFTNPIEVVKVRQQTLFTNSVTPHNARPGLIQTFADVYRTQGIRGLQSGLQLAMFREGSKALLRIGCYRPILDQMHDPSNGSAPISKRMAAGMTSGAVASFVFNPIELVKTRQQGKTSTSGFNYKGPIDGLRQLSAEGVGAMWRGTGVAMVRSAMVTGPHLTTYTSLKEYMLEKQYLPDSTPLHVLCALSGGLAGISCNHPFDTIRNRLYTQPLTSDGAGKLYASAWDCSKKMLRAEGPQGFYRGFIAHYVRVGPHYVITFIILEQLSALLRT